MISISRVKVLTRRTYQCCYAFCQKKFKRTRVRRFMFPVKDIERCKKWVENSGNPHLASMSLEELRIKSICADHFSKKYFLTRKLAATAVPIPYVGGYSRTVHRKTYVGASSCPQISATPDQKQVVQEVKPRPQKVKDQRGCGSLSKTGMPMIPIVVNSRK